MYPAGREVCYAVMKRFIPSCAQEWQAGELLQELIWWWSTLVAGYLMCLGCHQHTLVTNYFVWDVHYLITKIGCKFRIIRSCCGFSPHGEALYRWRLGNIKLVIVSEGDWSLKQQSNS